MALAVKSLRKEDVEAMEELKEDEPDMYFDKLKEMALIMKYAHMVNIHQRIKDYNKDKYPHVPSLCFSPFHDDDFEFRTPAPERFSKSRRESSSGRSSMRKKLIRNKLLIDEILSNSCFKIKSV